MQNKDNSLVLIDASRLIIEGVCRAGADIFIGYPITPANLLYLYAIRRFPVMLPAPDEITTLQWMSGLSAAGKIPVTATSFPGFALMVESVNMAFMMELPMVIVIAQRLGPATGTATCGATGDLLLLRGMISGGYQVPVLCLSDYEDSWKLSAKAVQLAEKYRTPVIVLTSKEMVMTQRSFNLNKLSEIEPVNRKLYNSDNPYLSYEPEENLIPQFLPLGNSKHQVRISASTHDRKGILQHTSDESIENTLRLDKKIVQNIKDFTYYDLIEDTGAETIIVSYDITASAAREARELLIKENKRVSLLIVKTILPIPNIYYDILDSYKKVIIAEENANGQFSKILFGERIQERIINVCSIGKMVSPQDIINNSGLMFDV